jgi:hypothetical protein
MGQTPGVLLQITLGWHTLPPPEAGKSTPKGKIEMSDAENMGEQLMRLDAPVRRTDGHLGRQELDHVRPGGIEGACQSVGQVVGRSAHRRRPSGGIEGARHTDVRHVLTTIYAPHKHAGSLPTRSHFKINVLVPFVDAKVNIARSTDNWIPRPN